MIDLVINLIHIGVIPIKSSVLFIAAFFVIWVLIIHILLKDGDDD